MKTQLVVIDEHTLAYIEPEQIFAYVLHASILRGSPYGLGSHIAHEFHKVRLATEKDFDDYRVCMDGYKNSNQYLYEQL